MASIHKEILINAKPEDVWGAIRDVGMVHKRLVPGILIDAHLDGNARIVKFANGLVVRELIVDINDQTRRFAYAASGGRTTHHNASVQVFDNNGGSRVVWISDFLPNEVTDSIQQLVNSGAEVMKRTLEAAIQQQ